MARPPSSLWLVTKPVGATSASLVDALRRELAGDHPLKVSHGGALDPFAEGLVVLLVGSANRLFERLHEAPKVYRAEVVWGTETDTCDAGGRPVARPGGAAAPQEGDLDRALAPFLGWTDQVPPNTSNKWVDGERAYARAHRGEEFTLPPQRVFCHGGRWVAHDLPRASTLEVVVRGGFYVRSLARDLGRTLGCGAHLRALVREAIGPWRAPTQPVTLTGPAVLPWVPMLTLTDAEWGDVRRGAALPARAAGPAQWSLPAGFPPTVWRGGVHRGRLVAVQGEGPPVLLPGGI